VEVNLVKINQRDFKEVYQIMKASFPKEEIRTFEESIKQLENEKYTIFSYKTTQEEMIGFIAQWEFESCFFLEYFAIDEKYRGTGIGTEVLQKYLKTRNKKVILEVENNHTIIGKRRINFYKRMGFHLLNCGYLQPKLNEDDKKEVPLKMMSYPENLNKEKLLDIKDEVFKIVYQKI
jgi:ribosomal protein S18 acetylase RimI-like enzyme